MDYREVDKKFDGIVSVGMFEHVGHKNYETFFRKNFFCFQFVSSVNLTSSFLINLFAKPLSES